MECEIYTGNLFYMGCDPETKKNTIRIEIEVNDIDFDTLKEKWAESNEIDIHIAHN